MAFYLNERIGLFIDGANLYSAAKALEFDIDYKKLLEEFRKRGRLMRSHYYTALIENEEYSPLRPLIDWLDYNGFKVITKPTREYIDSQGKKRIKGDMDVELTVDVMEAASVLDHIVLFSGDGNFKHLIEAVQRQGCRVSIISTLKSNPPMVSDELRRQADAFVDLSDIIELVGRAEGEVPEHGIITNFESHG